MQETNLNEVEPRGPWIAFSYVGFISGIIALVFMLFPFTGFAIGIEGLVFSILGKKSVRTRNKAQTGITLNSIAIGINLLWSISFIILMIYGVFEAARA